jgi:sugar phosphate isomerase/epimerase
MTLSRALILSYASAYGTTFESFLETAHDIGFRSVQLTPDQTPNLCSELSTDRITRIRERARTLDVTIHLHNVFYDINPASLVPPVRELALQVTREVFALGAALNARTVTVHPGYMFPGWRRNPLQAELFWRDAVRAFADLASIADAFGVPLLLENGSYHLTTAAMTGTIPLHLGIRPDELTRIVQLCGPGTGIVLDIGKSIHSGVDPMVFATMMGDRIRQIQVSTFSRHGESAKAVITALSAGGAEIGVVCEGGVDDALETARGLQSLLGPETEGQSR